MSKRDPNKITHRGVTDLKADKMPEHPSERDDLLQELIKLTAKYERLKEFARRQRVTLLELENTIVDLKIEARKCQEEVRQIYNELQRTRGRAAARTEHVQILKRRLRKAKTMYESLVANYKELATAYVDSVKDERLKARVKRWLEKNQ